MTENSAGSILSVQLSPWMEHYAELPRASPATATLAKSPKYTLRLEIIRAFEPFTMSVACHVKLIDCIDEQGHAVENLGVPAECIMKLYDRRHANNMPATRKGFLPFNPSREAEIQAFLDARRAAQDNGLPRPQPSYEIEIESEIYDMVERASAMRSLPIPA